MHKIGVSGELLCRLLVPLVTTGLPLMKNVLKSLAKRVLIPLGLTVTSSARDAAIHNKMFGSGMTTLIISNEEMNDIMKIVKFLEESVLLIQRVGKSFKTKAIKKQKEKKKDYFLECYQAL